MDRRLTEEEQNRVNAFMVALDRVTNPFSGRVMMKEIAERMATEHCSLQQRYMGLVLMFVAEMAENYEQRRFDARNESACDLANQIKDKLGKHLLGELPYI